MRSRILVVGQDVALRARLARLLNGAGYAVELAENAAHAQRIGLKNVPLALVAQDALARQGEEMLAELRGAARRIVLIGSRTTAHRFGLDVLDAHDERALLERVAAEIEPAAADEVDEPILAFTGYTLDVAGRTLTDETRREIALTRGEFTLLNEFAQRPGRVLSRDHLLRALAGREAEPFDRSIDMLIVRLRRKIEPDPKRPRLIVTVPGSGYKFAPHVQPAEAPPPPPVVTVTPPPSRSAAADRRQVTALSAELLAAGGAALPEDPEELGAVIEAFRERAGAVVTGHGGTLAPSLHRELLAYFGYPVGLEDAAERAVRAALALGQAFARETSELAAGLGVRVGIATGLVVADAAGEIVGEAPSEAARLQALAEPGRVVIAASTQRLVGALFTYRDLGSVAVKGFDAPVRAWEVLGASPLASRSELLHEAPLAPLIGREDELDSLLRGWAQAKAGEARMVLVSGEAGIGKSRLLAALEERLADEPHRSLRYFCSPQHQQSALYPIIARWEREAGFAPGDSPAERRRKLEAILSPADLSPADVALIAGMLSVPMEEADAPGEVSPQRRKERTVAALQKRLTSLARAGPVLMLLEDVHWADPSTLELVDIYLERFGALPILLVLSSRPEFAAPWIGRPGVTLLTLSRLNRRQSAALATQAAGGRSLPPALLEGIVDQADGVPLFIEELTKAVLESGLAEARDADATPGGLLRALAVPATLQASLMARLDRVPTARRVAQVGAAIGRDFSDALLRAVAEEPAATVEQGLAALVRSGIVLARGVAPEATYSFKHALVQDAAYGSLLHADRRGLHARIVAALEAAGAELAESEPEVLAHHCTEAGQMEQAAQWWLRAGTAALRRAATAEALAQLGRGLAAVAAMPDGEARRRLELDLWIARIKALMSAEGHAATTLREAFQRAQVLCEQLDSAAQLVTVLYGQWSHAFVRGDLPEALRQARGLLAFAEARDDPVCRLIGLQSAGLTSLPMGAFGDVRRHLGEGLALFDPDKRAAYAAPVIGDPRVLMRNYLAWGLMCEGQFAACRREAAAANEEARALGQLWSLAQTLSSGAYFAVMLDSPEAGLRVLDELDKIAKEHAFVYFGAHAIAMRGWCLAVQGDAEQGGMLLRRGGDLLRKAGSFLWVPSQIRMEAEAIGASGRIAEAHARLDEALQLAIETGARWDLPEFDRARAGLFAAAGDRKAAQDALRRALAQARDLGARLFELRAATALAQSLVAEDRCGEALELLAPVLSSFAGEDAADLSVARRLMESMRAASPVSG
jgi:DNA-binding response OmpR family regulator/class 3 adenylate cyclase